MGQFPSVAGHNALVGFVGVAFCCHLVEDGDDEDCCFSHSGFGLAEDIVSLEGEGDGLDLNFAGVFEAALPDGSFELVLEEELVPSCEVGACIFLLLEIFGFFLFLI
jgi:hypothetical protein